MFTLAISCLTMSNLPWFVDLTFQVSIQYCSIQHQALLPDTSTTEHHFHFGPVSSFYLELFLHSSPVAYWTLSDLGSSSAGVISFCLFILFMGCSRQEYWSSLPFPPLVNHILSELFSTMTCPSWVALYGKPLCHDKGVIHEGTSTHESILVNISKFLANKSFYKSRVYSDLDSANHQLAESRDSQVVLMVKNPPANKGDTRDMGSIPASGVFPGEGNGNPLQYLCL